MRWSLSVSAVALLLLSPLGVLAQDAPTIGEPYRILEDSSEDYYASLKEGPGMNDPTAYYEFMDMEWLDVTESEDGFLFTLKVVDIEGYGDESPAEFSDGGFFWIHFTHHDWDYQLQIERKSGQTQIEMFAVLQSKFVDAEEWGFLFQDDEGVTWDSDAETISYFVSREDLADGRGAEPYPGRSLTDWWVIASQQSSQAESEVSGENVGFPWELHDRMPDDGVGEKSFPVQSGLQQSGGARLYSDQPFRASNGEATTFLYTVMARNEGSGKDLFSLEATGVPANWQVQLPVLGVELDAGEEIPLPVLVSTPFGHQHGGTDSFILELRSTTEADSVGRIEIGVRYLKIAMPAGHHPEVYLHSRGNTGTASFDSAFQEAFEPSGSLWFNTWDQDESDADVPVSAYANPGEADFSWFIPLDPTLRMGLDFDMEAIGSTEFTITAPEPMQDVTLTGKFVLNQAGGDYAAVDAAPELATFSADGLTWGSPGASQTITVDVIPQEAGDYVPYDASNEMWLVIHLSGTGISTFNQNTVPAIEAGASFLLPLNEYEDDISDAYNALSGAAMTALTPATRDANPGDVILFDVDITAYEGADGTYTLDIIGPGADVPEIVSADSVSLDGGTPVTATVMVQVPADADDGDTIDFFLQATHSTDSQRRGLIRLVVEVDTTVELEDDFETAATAGYLGEEAQDSPMPLPVVFAGLLVALAVARRRRP